MAEVAEAVEGEEARRQSYRLFVSSPLRIPERFVLYEGPQRLRDARQRLLVLLRKLLGLRDAHANIAQQAIGHAIQPAMHRDGLIALPRALDDRRLAHIDHLLDHIELAQAL